LSAIDKKLEMMIAENCKKYTYTKYKLFSRSPLLLNQECSTCVVEEKFKEYAVKDIISGYGDIKNKKILEVGCGTGGLSVALELAGGNCYGIEPDFYGATTACLRSNRYDGNSQFVMAAGELMPFKDEIFDIVISFVVIEHVQDISAVLHEINRVLKRGGIYICLHQIIFGQERNIIRFFILTFCQKNLEKYISNYVEKIQMD